VLIVSLDCVDCSGHVGLTVPDVKAALARFEKFDVEVFKPLAVASNETIPVPHGLPTIVPGYADVYKQIAMIRVWRLLLFTYCRIRMVISLNLFPTILRRTRYKARYELKFSL
jgi:hypothetical protein